MPTIKDIARIAGVSHGTVSNVLNKKGNVSAEKIKIVEETARKLGYHVNTKARTLRKGISNSVSVIMPYNLKDRYSSFYQGLILALKKSDIDANLIFMQNQNELVTLLDKEFSSLTMAVIIVGIDIGDFEISNNKESLVYTIDSTKELDNCSQWNLDYTKSVSDLSNFVENSSYKELVVLNNASYIDNVWLDIISRANKNNLPVTNCSLKSNGLKAIFEVLQSANPSSLFVCLDENILKSLQEASVWLKKNKLNILALTDYKLLHNKEVHYYEINLSRLGFEVGKKLLNDRNVEVVNYQKIKYRAKGFVGNDIHLKTKSNEVVRFLTIDSPMTEALKLVLTEFEQTTGCKVELTSHPYSVMQKKLFSDKNYGKQFDLIRFDVSWLTQLYKFMTPLDEIAGINTPYQNLNSSLPNEFSMVNNIHYGIPFDVSVQMLYYREDLFSDNLIQRQYYESYKENLEVPRTFAEFDQVSKFFTKEYNPNSPTLYGCSKTVVDSDISVAYYLPRLREAIGDRSYINPSELSSLIDSTLVDYIENSTSKDTYNKKFWQDIAKSLASGETAMEILFTNYAADIKGSKLNKETYTFSAEAVPGNKPLIGGGVIGIPKTNEVREVVIDFIEWLYSNQTTRLLNRLGGFIYTKEQVEDIQLIENHSWLMNVEDSFSIAGRRKLAQFDFNLYDENELLKLIKQKASEIDKDLEE